MSANYDEIAILKTLLFGTSSVPTDFNERLRGPGAPQQSVQYDADVYLNDGPGRYAWPARANLIEYFFTQFQNLPVGTYSISQLSAAAQISDGYAPASGDLVIPINNYQTDPYSSDWPERAFIFGESQARLQEATFIVAQDGTRTIDGIVIQPDSDNFDFESGNPDANLINQYLSSRFDPYNLGNPAVDITFTQASIRTFNIPGGTTQTYTYDMYLSDKQTQADLTYSFSASVIVNLLDGSAYLDAIENDMVLARFEAGYFGIGKEVIYQDPNLSELHTLLPNNIIVGDPRSNVIYVDHGGAEVYASYGDDVIYIRMGSGQQYFDGYEGLDSIDYSNVDPLLQMGITVELSVSVETAAAQALVSNATGGDRDDRSCRTIYSYPICGFVDAGCYAAGVERTAVRWRR